MSRKQSPNWLGVLAAAAAAGVVLWLLFGRSQSSTALATSAPRPALMQAQGQAQQQAQQAAAALQAARNAAQGAGTQAQAGVVQGTAEPVYVGPQPVDLAYEEYDDRAAINQSPLYVTRSNEYLSQANPELAAWDSSHLLPNAALSNCQDGNLTNGPSFNQLQVFSGNNLFEASISERYMLEQPTRKLISLADLRPLPAIATSSSTASFWNQSSLGIQDVSAGLTHYNSALCSHNNSPTTQISAPTHGAITALGGMPQQTSVGGQ